METELQNALKHIPEDWNGGDPLWRESILVLRKTAKRVANGIGKAAIELIDSDGNHQWVVTVIVDGPGDFTVLSPALGITTEDDDA